MPPQKHKTTLELEADIVALKRQVDALSTSVADDITSAVKKAELECRNTFIESLDERIHTRFRTATLFAGLILAGFAVVGYIGLPSVIATVIRERIGTNAIKQIEDIRFVAHQELLHIQTIRRASSSPLIVLQTDFGNKSYYMGRLKGVIYSINPNARIDVITSEVNDFDLVNAAFTLWRASRFYPEGTIFVVITNPGGITAEMVIVETLNKHIYIGHDNGCLDLVVEKFGYRDSYRIASPELTPPQFSDLFGGVDTFGPSAAKLSMGFELSKAGPKLTNYTFKLPQSTHVVGSDNIVGTVMDIDKYGNATLNIEEHDLDQVGIRINGSYRVQLDGGTNRIEIPFKRTYGNVSKGAPVLILYEGLLQLALNEGDFSRTFNINRGTMIRLYAIEGK